MRSPFAIFRTHQKTLMVIVFGMSMIGFVFLGAVNDPANMPKALVFITVAAVVGGAAWIAGMPSGKSQEYGLWGVLMGLVAALAFSLVGSGPQLAVMADSGDITIEQMRDLQRRREIANGFVNEALRTTRSQRDAERLSQKYSFGYFGSIDEDLVTGELLRREADKLGLQVNDAAVTAFINELTDNKMSAENYKDLRRRLQVSGPDLYAVLAGELQARMAADYLYGISRQDLLGYSPAIPPEEYWDLYRRMNVKQRVEVAPLPVKNFLDESAEPTKEELAELFDKYRANEPLVSPEERFEEGRPGFKQPRRVQIGYLEAVFDKFKPNIGEITDSDIQSWYQERYVKPAEEAAARAAAARRTAPSSTGPSLPDTLELDLPELPAQPANETPASESPPTDAPASDTPSTDAPATEAPASDAPASEPPATDPPASETPQPESSPSDTPPATEPKPEETSLIESPSDNGLFSVADGETPAESPPANEPPPAADTPAASEPAAPETPAAEQPSTPVEQPADPAATEAPASETPANPPETPIPAEQPESPADAPATDAPAADGTTPAAETSAPTNEATTPSQTPPEATPAGSATPAAPQPSVPLLDDALRAQIRTQIENARTVELLQKAVEDAAQYIDEHVGLPVRLPKDDPEYKSPEAAAELLKTYAAEHNLHYAETPLLSYLELQDDEDHPVGAARIADDPSGNPLAGALFQTGSQDVYRAVLAEHPVTQSWFAAWKLSEQQPYVPETLDDERVREQVTRTWRELQARERAKARGEELVAKASATDQSLTASLAETTITGKEGDLFIEVKETPEFSWLSKSSAVDMNPFRPELPRIHDPAGVEEAGIDFMRTVFDELAPGEIGVAPNMDRSVYYVVRVVSRTPSPTDEAELERFRERFLREPVFEHDPFLARLQIDYPSPYEQLSVMETLQDEPNWARGPGGLWSRHGAQLVPFQPAVAAQVQ